MLTLTEIAAIGGFVILGMAIGAGVVWAHRVRKSTRPSHKQTPGYGECDGCGQICSDLHDGFCSWCNRVYRSNQ